MADFSQVLVLVVRWARSKAQKFFRNKRLARHKILEEGTVHERSRFLHER